MRGGRPREVLGTKTRLDTQRTKSSVLPDESTLQLLFAELNNHYFNGEIPACKISYNARFSNSAGRITYTSRPMVIELSPKHFREKPEALRETLLHEMIHAWLHARGQDPGHTAQFKKKMRECGIGSIYHDMGNVAPFNESKKRYILRCAKCAMEVLRKRRPSAPMSCGRCSKRGFDRRFPLTIYEVTELREAGSTISTAANAGR